MESERSMSRREIVVNALLGSLLLLVLFVYFTAIAVIFMSGFLGFDWVIRRLLAGITLPADFSFFVILALITVWYSIGHARKGRWRNVFLDFVSIPLMGFAWFTLFPSIGGHGNAGLYVLPFFSMFPVFIVFDISGDTNLGRLRFFLATAVAAASVSVNSGLLGDGVLARTVANSLSVAAAAWMIGGIRKGWKKTPPDQPHALPTVGA
jgi:hypothetical protein